MSAKLDPAPDPQELQGQHELQDLKVRVVRLSELGARAARPAPKPPPPAPPVHNGHARHDSQPRPAPGAAPKPAARPAPEPAPAPAPEAKTARSPQPVVVPRPAVPTGPVLEPERRRFLTSPRLMFVLVCAVLFYGWNSPTERYINPNRGLGYALGIIGGSLMLIVLVYSLRKRWEWLRFLGSTPGWFRFHMVLGIVGPLCVLYHSNFSIGAANSNVALFSMLAVAGSGVIGRYIYSRIHEGLYGRKIELSELRAGADGLRNLAGSISFLPELVTKLDVAEQRLLKVGPRGALLGFAKPMFVSLVTTRSRWRLHGYIRHALHASARESAVVALEHKRLRATARTYVDRRLASTRRVASFEGFERLFSLWHALHIPLIFVMVIAAVIHVIAVHVY
jgi:hypothetical protein